MFFSKKGAKVLALTSAFAFALAGLSYSPAKVQAAADKAPTVKVLGATLRLDGDSGKQSLRFGIEVSNASNAEACGIEITYGTKTITVATDVNDSPTSKKHTDIYSKDVENDTIVYSAVVKGIPKKNYGNMFDIKGYVKQSIDVVEKELSDSVPRSVDKVVKSMQEINPNIKLDAKGDLVKVVSVVDGKETTEPVTAGDFAEVDKMEVSKGIVDLSEEGVVVADGCTPTYNKETKAIDALVGMHTGIIVKSPLDTDDYRMYKKVKLTYTTSSSNFAFYIFDGQMGNEGKGPTPAGNVDKGKLEATNEPKTVEFYAAKALYGIKLVNMGGEADFHINSVEFCEEVAPDVVEVDLSGVTTFGEDAEHGKEAPSTIVNKDGSLTITWSNTANNGSGVKLPLERGMDLTGYTCYVDAEGADMVFNLYDAGRYGSGANPPYWCPDFHVLQKDASFPYSAVLNDDNLYKKTWDQKDVISYDGKAADYNNVGGVKIDKGYGKPEGEYSLTIKSIVFRKNGIKPSGNTFDLDISKFESNKNVSVTKNQDGSVTLDWIEECDAWAGIDLKVGTFPVNLSEFSKMIIKTKGENGESLFCVCLRDNSRVGPYGGAASVAEKYEFDTNVNHNLKDLFNKDYNGNNPGGDDGDYTNVSSVFLNTNDSHKAVSVTITGISFIKDTP